MGWPMAAKRPFTTIVAVEPTVCCRPKPSRTSGWSSHLIHRESFISTLNLDLVGGEGDCSWNLEQIKKWSTKLKCLISASTWKSLIHKQMAIYGHQLHAKQWPSSRMATVRWMKSTNSNSLKRSWSNRVWPFPWRRSSTSLIIWRCKLLTKMPSLILYSGLHTQMPLQAPMANNKCGTEAIVCHASNTSTTPNSSFNCCLLILSIVPSHAKMLISCIRIQTLWFWVIAMPIKVNGD